MNEIPLQKLNEYRSRTFRLSPGQHVSSKKEAIQFVNQRGFVFFWPIKDILLPSLWAAVAGDRAVAEAHDDPGHVTWGWKDSLLGARRWYYAKVLRKRATIISLETAPLFYALSNNFGSPDEDYLIQYMQGQMIQEAKAVYEVLLDKGPMDTISLRRAAHLTSRESDSRFNRALVYLQGDFKILPVGISQAGGWRYAFIYDLVHRHYPDLIELARYIQENDARQKLIHTYLTSVGAARLADIRKLFQWPAHSVNKAIKSLQETNQIAVGLKLAQQTGEWIAIPDVL